MDAGVEVTAMQRCSAPGGRRLLRATRRSAARGPGSAPPAAQLVEPDEGLRVLAGVDRAVEVVERPLDELDALVLLDLRLLDVAQAGGEEHVHLLVAEAGRAPVGLQVLPVLAGLADLLGELAPGRVQRPLAPFVELAGRQLEQVRHADRLPWL